MRFLIPTVFAVACFVSTGQQGFAADHCCECGCEYKLKKIYRPVVTFKKVTYKCYDWCTTCEDVLAPTTTCCKKCGCGPKRCSCPGKPRFITVPVAKQHACKTCTRMVPCVSWVVECRCEKCCKKSKHHHHHDPHDRIHKGHGGH